MALADALARIKNSLKETFHIQPFDAAPHRKKLVAKLKTAKNQIEAGRTNAADRIWWTGNGGTGVMLELNGHVVEVGGETWNTLPEGEVSLWIDDMIGAINDGELDGEIEAAVEGVSPRVEEARTSVASKPAKVSSGQGSGRTFTPEGRVNIAMNNRYNKGRPDAEVQAKLIAAGHDEAIVKAAIKARKKA